MHFAHPSGQAASADGSEVKHECIFGDLVAQLLDRGPAGQSPVPPPRACREYRIRRLKSVIPSGRG